MARMSESPTAHMPVLLGAVLQWLAPKRGGVYVDGTLGGGGHARALAESVSPDGLVIGLDRDPAAINAGTKRLAGLPVRLAQANFCDLPEVLEQLKIAQVDGVLLDLGLSSDQLADENRGFSFFSAGPLDLRFDPTEGEPARRLVNRLGYRHLAELIAHYGEERFSRRIARAIIEARQQRPIETAQDLAVLVARCVPPSGDTDRIHPATRTFQALRIAVNDELKSLEIALRRIPDYLRQRGKLAVISFHSLEDRHVKEAFLQDPRMRPLTRRPIRAEADEIERNPRCRGAKLRVAERI
jgi:16S rRNA (cytosine1402-N4)-methyltransferase